jgi:hypothetical protein
MTSESLLFYDLFDRSFYIPNIDTCDVCEEGRHFFFLLCFFYLVVVPTFQPLIVSIQLRPSLQTDIERGFVWDEND